jgi:hypothetical protein
VSPPASFESNRANPITGLAREKGDIRALAPITVPDLSPVVKSTAAPPALPPASLVANPQCKSGLSDQNSSITSDDSGLGGRQPGAIASIRFVTANRS